MHRRAALVALAAILATIAASSIGCKDAPLSFLPPPGREHDADFENVYLAGTFTNWDASRFVPARSMNLVDDHVWQQVVTLPAGAIGFKFVIAVKASGEWDALTKEGASSPLSGTLSRVSGGTGNEVKLSIPTTGDWIFTFYERGPTGVEGPSYSIVQRTKFDGRIDGVVEFSDLSVPPYPAAQVEAKRAGAGADTAVTAVTLSDTLTGAFALEGLTDGPYAVRITRQGYRDSVITGIQIAGENTVSLGRVRLPRGAFLSGWVSMFLTGDFTTPNWTPNDPAQQMTLIGDYTWQKTTMVPLTGAPPRTIHWKFVTDGIWDSDYGTSSGQNGLTGPTTIVGGVGTDLAAPITAAGTYTFTLHEKGYQGDPARAWYEIVGPQ
jgi:hypothetical protein